MIAPPSFPPDLLERAVKALIDSGYRKVSNKYRMVARVDVTTPPLACFNQHTKRYMGDDYFRRGHSRDCLKLPSEVFRRIPTSGHCETGCLPVAPDLAEILALIGATKT